MTKNELSYDTKFLIVLVSFFILYPVGIILMFKWMSWKIWIKWLLTLPLVIAALGFIFAIIIGFVSTANFATQIKNAKQESLENFDNASNRLNCTEQCAELNIDKEIDNCIQDCLRDLNK